jgi:hypothetical protein
MNKDKLYELFMWVTHGITAIIFICGFVMAGSHLHATDLICMKIVLYLFMADGIFFVALLPRVYRDLRPIG